MTRACGFGLLTGFAVLLAASAAPAQDNTPADHETSFVRWQWYRNVSVPPAAGVPYFAFLVPPEVYGRARAGLVDLRLADAHGQRVPYALRVLRTQAKQQDVPVVRRFNEGPSSAGYYQVDAELKDIGPPGYNEIDLDTPGTTFRRRVEVVGDRTDQFKDPQPVLSGPARPPGHYLVHFPTDAGVVEVRRLHFDFKQYPYLQIRVFADPVTGEGPPHVTHIAVRRTTFVEGTYLTRPAELGPREPVRGDGGPGSAWFITLGDPVPCEALRFRVAGEEVDRPLRLEIANPNEPRQDVAGIDWRWHKVGQEVFLEARFPEVVARRFRLVVTDFDNDPLNLTGVQSTSCARQIVFELPAGKGFVPPLRLYYGNPEADAPHYDLERKLPAVLTPAPREAKLGDPETNPDYQPPPQTLGERFPWLIYVVLGAASLGLLTILALLARQAIARADAAAPVQS